LGRGAFRRHGRIRGACFIEIEQTEGGFSGIVFHGVMGQLEIFSTVTANSCVVIFVTVVVAVVLVVDVVVALVSPLAAT